MKSKPLSDETIKRIQTGMKKFWDVDVTFDELRDYLRGKGELPDGVAGKADEFAKKHGAESYADLSITFRPLTSEEIANSFNRDEADDSAFGG